MRWLGPVLMVGGIGAAAWWALRPSGWDASLSGLSIDSLGLRSDDTSTRRNPAGPSAAQVLQDLRQDEAQLEARIDTKREAIRTEYELRRARYQFGHPWMKAESERLCAGEGGIGFWNPYGSCDDDLQKRLLDELEAWRTRERAELRELEAELDSVQAEIESVALTVAG